MKMKENIKKELSGSFWKKIDESKEKGINAEEFSRIEELEGGIAKLEGLITEMKTKIDECKKEIKLIKKQAKNRLHDESKRIMNE